MKELLTTRIVFALNAEQIKLITAQLKLEKRQTLFTLYKLLMQKKEESEINKSEVFIKLFKKKWTKENDYLLRNELKILKDKIEEIYIQDHFVSAIKDTTDRIRLDFYRNLKVTDEFTGLYREYIENKEQQLNFDDCLEYSFIYADYIRLNTSNYSERYRLLEENLTFFEQALNKNITMQMSKFYLMKAHVLFQQKQLHNQKNNIDFEYKPVTISTDDYKNEFSDYCIAYANAYKNFDTSTIEQWETVYTLLQKVSKNTPHIEEEHCFTLGNLATICSIRSDFAKADQYFEILFKNISPVVLAQNIALTLNYITNLNKLKKYEAANLQLKKGEQVFGNKIKTFSQFKTQEIVVACFLKDTKKLGKLLAIDFETLQPFERIYYRLFYCIYFIIIDNIELAFTEIQNLQRSKLMTEIDTQFSLVADFFFICIKNMQSNQHKKKLPEKALTEITEANQKVIDANFPMFLNYTPYLWMKERIGIN